VKQISLVSALVRPDAGRMSITPDSKDWTWVLNRPCPECGLDTSTFAASDTPVMLRTNAEAWREVLAGANVRERPDPTTWSPLEYGAHVRDVCRVYAERLHLMLTQDAPNYPNWDQDQTAVDDRYNEQDPAKVAEELVEAADHLADRLAEVAGDQWHRTGTRSDGAHFTIDTFARYFIHDPIHHLHDVTNAAPSETRG
jgi:hypothetical protein